MGIEPTGEEIECKGIDIVRMPGEKATERWGQFDDLGMMKQIGAVPDLQPQPA